MGEGDNDQAYTPLVAPQPAYDNSQQAYPPQVYQQQPIYGAQPYPQQQGYQPQQQQGYQPQQQQGYQPQNYPMQGYPPQQPLGYPQEPAVIFVPTPEDAYMYDASAGYVPTTLSFGDQAKNLPKLMWTAISSPKLTTFESLKVQASWNIVFFILFIKVVLLMILQILNWYAVKSEISVDSSTEHLWYSSLGFAVGYTILSIPLYFFLFNGLFTGLARCMAGTRPELYAHPTYLQLCFVYLLFDVPLGIIGGIITLIPVIGWWLALCVSIYSLVLFVLTLRGVFHLTTGQAVGIIIIFVIAVTVLFLIFFFAVGAAFATLVVSA